MSSIMLLLTVGGVLLLIPTAYAGKIGAPFAPTRIAAVKKAFDAINLGSRDVLVDLGAGDGKIMREGAARGAKVFGYELSPIMWVVAWVRTWGRGKVIYANFFKRSLPADTTVVFSFLMPQHMGKVGTCLQKQNLPKLQYVLSYAFPFPDIDPALVVRENKCAPLYVYEAESIMKREEV